MSTHGIMVKNSQARGISIGTACIMICCLLGCQETSRFDGVKKSVSVGNWTYALQVHQQGAEGNKPKADSATHYLKAALSISNTKTGKSLLYSGSRDAEDYEIKYKYLAFSSQRDLYLQHGNETIYPVGSIFEPSNGLSPADRLVYKFRLTDAQYHNLQGSKTDIEYWYTDHIIGLGKICFNVNN